MPKKFEDILKSIKDKMKGKNSPRTKKPYTDSEIYAIAMSTYKKKYGTAPSKEESPKWYFDGSKEIREDVKLDWEEVIEFEKSQSSIDEPLKINGRAINETITNNRVKYLSEELDMAAPSMIGKPLLNSHNHSDVRETLGVVTDAVKVAGGINYVAEIDPDERKIINKVKRGYINKVSICADCKTLEKEVVEEGDKAYPIYVAKGMTFRELSLVTVPGDDNSSISVEMAISESFNEDEVCEEFLQDVDKVEEEVNEEVDEKKGVKVKEMSEDIKVMEEKLTVALKEKEEMATKLAVIEAEQARLAKEAEFKTLVSEAVKAELSKIKEEDKEDEEDEEEAVKEKSNAPIVSESKKNISEELGDAYNKLVIERSANGTSFYYAPKEDIKGGLQ